MNEQLTLVVKNQDGRAAMRQVPFAYFPARNRGDGSALVVDDVNLF
jgi:hypothetical protein